MDQYKANPQLALALSTWDSAWENFCTISHHWCNQDFFQDQDDLVILSYVHYRNRKIKTKTLISRPRPRPRPSKSVQNHDQDLHLKTSVSVTKSALQCTFLWCIPETDPVTLNIYCSVPGPTEKHFSFSAVNENAGEIEIPFTAENETKTKMDIHFRPKNENESHLTILVFFFTHSVTKSALQCATNTSSSFAFFAAGPCWQDSTFLMYSV